MEIPKFLKKKQDSLLFNQEGELVYHIPEKFFENGCAVIIGEHVSLIGIFSYEIRNANGKTVNGIRNFNFPTRFMCKPYDIEKVKNYKLTPDSEAMDFRFLKFAKDDEVVTSTKVPQDITNVEDLYRLTVTSGNIPPTIKYSELHNYFLESMDLNGGNYGVQAQLFGILIGELCRNKSDISIPFRLSKNKLKQDTNYKSISIKDIPKYVSPFSAITSENWDESVMAAIMNDKEVNIPLEKVLTK